MKNVIEWDKIKLISSLKLLTKKELLSFKKMVQSPYFNQQEEMVRLIEVLATSFPKFEKMETEDRFCQLVLNTNNGFGPKEKETLKRLFFKTNQLVNQFLVLEHLNNSKKHLKQRLLLDELQYRNGSEQATFLLTKAEKQLEKEEVRELDFLYAKYMYSEIDFFLQIHFNNRGRSNQMQNLLNDFRKYFIGQGLNYYCAAINREQILQVDYDYPLLDAMLQYLDNHEADRSTPFIQAWYRVVKLLKTPDSNDHFFAILTILNQHQNQFSVTGNRQLFGFILNHCSVQVMKGDLTFLKHSFNLYKQALEAGFLLVENKLSPHHFTRIVKKALEYDKVEWASLFIETYGDKLDSNFKEEVVILSKAMVTYATSNPTEANELLSRLRKTEDVFYELDYKVLLLKIYYDFIVKHKEDSYELVLNNFIESLRIYLLPTRRKLMAEPIRIGYSNFLNSFKKLKKCSEFGKINTELVNQFQQNLKQTTPLFEKVWLLKEANLLMG